MRPIRHRTRENLRLAAISRLLASPIRSRYDRYLACGTGRNKYATPQTAVAFQPVRRAVTKPSNKPTSNKYQEDRSRLNKSDGKRLGIFGEVTERPKVRHWKCRVGVIPHRGFESRPLRFLLKPLDLRPCGYKMPHVETFDARSFHCSWANFVFRRVG